MLLSTALQGCARTDTRPAAPAAIAVEARVAPPADLIACPARPEGFPAKASATMAPAVRFAAIRLATAYAATIAQLERLIGFETGTPCPAARVDAAAGPPPR